MLAGDLAGAEAALSAASPEGPLAGLARPAALLAEVQPEQAALRRAGREMLRQAAEDALAGDDPATAAPSLAAAISVWPDDPAFLQLAHDLDENAQTELGAGDATAAASVWAALAEVFENDAERGPRYRQRARRAALIARYQPDRIAQTRSEQAGIRRDAAADLLARVDAEYVIEPDQAAMARAGDATVRWLAEAPGAREAWPGASELGLETSGADHEDLAAALDAAVAAGTGAGLPAEVIVDEWVGGALASLDPWTRAVWPAEISAWESHNAGITEGAGLELWAGSDGEVLVARPLPETPAWESGIHQGDRVDRIADAGRSIVLAELPPTRRLAAAEDALLGEAGSPVTVDVTRNGAALTFQLTRASVVLETVQGYSRGEDNAWLPWLDESAGLAFVRVRSFKPTTEAAFDAMLEPALGRIEGVLLDLRGNPGGDVNAAVQIADRFVADGWLAGIAGRKLPDSGPDRDPTTGEPLAAWNQAVPGHALEGTPVVVLVDSGTASAAEVLAGALQERAGAIVVGQPTWGKGRAQALRSEPDLGYAVQFTNLVWTLPSGRRLEHGASGGGIQPGVGLPTLTPAERYQADLRAAERTALRTHADGTPMAPVARAARDDLPPLSADPTILAGELVLRAMLVP